MRRFFALIGIIIATAVLGIWLSPGRGEATTFKPDQQTVTFSTTALNANPDTTIQFNVLTPSSNFSAQAGGNVTFGDGDIITANDAAIPGVGAYVGKLVSNAFLGLANSGCFNNVPVTFHFAEATTSDTVLISPSGPPANLLANLAEDDGDLDNNGSVEQAGFANNGVADGADAYPVFVRDSLDPDGPGGATLPIVPKARYMGVAFVANTLIVILQFVILDASDGPGGAIDITNIPNLEWMTAPWGTPSVTFLQDPLAPPSNSAISDFCNFTSNTLLHGVTKDNACTPVTGSPPGCSGAGAGFTLRLVCDSSQGSAGGCVDCPTLCSGAAPNESGTARVTNPGTTQTIVWRQYTMSQRDWDSNAAFPADGDGTETNQEPCPTHMDSWNQRAVLSPEDQDDDGLPNVRATVVTTLTAAAPPGDTVLDVASTAGFAVGNEIGLEDASLQGESALTVSAVGASTLTLSNTTPVVSALSLTGYPAGSRVPQLLGAGASASCDTTGAPNTDPDLDGWVSRLDNCPLFANGTNTTTPNTFQFDLDVAIGVAVPDGGPHNDAIGPACDPNTTAVNGHYHATVVVTHLCIGPAGSDSDGDGECNVDAVAAAKCAGGVNDTDCDDDGVPDLTDNCIAGANAPISVNFAQSQRDLNADNFVDISDIDVLNGAFDRQGGSPTAPAGYHARLDLNYDRFTDISDIDLENGVFDKPC